MINNQQSNANRRPELNLPKRRWHLFGAFLLLGLTTLSLSAIAFAPAPEIDGNIAGEVALTPMPQPLAYTNLNANGDSLPDLLAGDVPQGENPTEIAVVQPETDALGNPLGNETGSEPSTGPKTIKINSVGQSRPQVKKVREITRDGPFGPLPTKSANGNSALKEYGKTMQADQSKSAVAIIIGGLGVNEQLTELAIRNLPAEVTLSFAAHSKDLQNWMDLARADGHEVLLEIPMESDIFDALEPGAARTLKVDNITPNKRNLDWLLSRAQGYFGVINYNGEKFLKRSDAASETLTRFSDSGLGFISDGAFETPSLQNLSRAAGLPYKQGFGLIDPEPQTVIIDIELRRLAATATSGANPIGVGFAYPETIQTVTGWINTLPSQSIQLVPASNLLE